MLMRQRDNSSASSSWGSTDVFWTLRSPQKVWVAKDGETSSANTKSWRQEARTEEDVFCRPDFVIGGILNYTNKTTLMCSGVGHTHCSISDMKKEMVIQDSRHYATCCVPQPNYSHPWCKCTTRAIRQNLIHKSCLSTLTEAEVSAANIHTTPRVDEEGYCMFAPARCGWFLSDPDAALHCGAL